MGRTPEKESDHGKEQKMNHKKEEVQTGEKKEAVSLFGWHEV
jgi:hypothetical protein